MAREQVLERERLAVVDRPITHAVGPFLIQTDPPSRAFRRPAPAPSSCPADRRRCSLRHRDAGRARLPAGRCRSDVARVSHVRSLDAIVPAIVTVPIAGRRYPAIARSSVVFPEPLGPRMVTNSCCSTSIETSRTTMGPPYPTEMLSRDSCGTAGDAVIGHRQRRPPRRCEPSRHLHDQCSLLFRVIAPSTDP